MAIIDENDECFMWVEQNGGWDVYNWVKSNIVSVCKKCLRAIPFVRTREM